MAGPVTESPAAGQPRGPAAEGPRAVRRRNQILESARDLLRRDGWHAVGIDEIGEAAGVSGPAVYRYFPTKQDVLTEALRYAAEQLWSSEPSEPGLDAYVRSHIEFTLDNVELIELWYAEARHLPVEARTDQRRLQRRYLEGWVDALLAARPELAQDEARLMVRAAIGLIHSLAHSENLFDRAHTRATLYRMTMSALEAP
jgi:AcrR family transcriptional regulator